MADKPGYLEVFKNLDEPTVQKLNTSLRPVSFKKNELLIVPGQVQRHLYLVKKGVQYSYFESDQKQHVIAFTYAPGLCAIPESFNFQQPSRYFLQCLSDSEFDSITFDALQHLMNESHALERIFRQLTEVVLAGVINRHMELQTLSIEERFKTFAQRSPHLLQLVPHKLLASYLHIDATNFSKLYNSVKI